MAAPAIGVRPRFAPWSAAIDWSHPLTVGLVGCGLADGAGWRDLVTGFLSTQGADGRSAPLATTLGFGTTQYGTMPTYPSGYLGTTRSASITAVVRAGTTLSSITNLVAAEVFGGATTSYGLVRLNSGVAETAWAGDSGAGYAVSGTTWTAGQTGVITGTSNGTNIFLYENGVQKGSTASVPNLMTFTRPISVGWSNVSTSKRNGDHAIPLWMWHDRPLPAGQVALLHADPFCFLRH